MNIRKFLINHEIKASSVRLIDEEGKQLGVLTREEALQEAEERGMDLVMVHEESTPPVCKIASIGQLKYEIKKKEKKARKGSKAAVTKELKMSPKISEHDYQVRVNQCHKFLEKGCKVKVTVFFKGRETTHADLGYQLLKRLIEDTKEYGIAENTPRLLGYNMILILSPK